MYQNLFTYIHNYIQSSLTIEEKEMIKSAFQLKKLRRKQFFLQEGEIARYTAFISKGAMRQYISDEKGGERIVNLFIENYWATERESFTTLNPSRYNIDVWEDAELLIITRESFMALAEKVPALIEMTRLMDDRNAIANQRRLTSTISYPAEKRYEDFVNNHPRFIERFPQHFIASFLGITKETLSRVKRQSIK
ncbi:Crp/Fnr family transcriptional regulator [Flavobacterium sp. RHBU_24]|uniref:Crp/Fnr family transcriptional regulator n=1 Tax=Flavobacterium sp. RHBU_24 TaxID=3391185 RepID=UPI003984EBAD